VVKLTREKQPGEAWLTVVEDGGSQILGYVKSGALNRITVGTGPSSVAVTPDGASVYCANNGANTVSVIDVVSGNVTDTIAVGAFPASVAVNPDGASVYCANSDDSTVSVIVEFPFYALGTG